MLVISLGRRAAHPRRKNRSSRYAYAGNRCRRPASDRGLQTKDEDFMVQNVLGARANAVAPDFALPASGGQTSPVPTPPAQPSGHDGVVHGGRNAARGYPQPAHQSPAAAVGTAIGAAVAAFVGSEAGRAAIEHALNAASALVKNVLGANGSHPALPLE